MIHYKQKKPAKHVFGKTVGFKKHAIGISLNIPQLLRSINRKTCDVDDFRHLKHAALKVTGRCTRVS